MFCVCVLGEVFLDKQWVAHLFMMQKSIVHSAGGIINYLLQTPCV